MVIRSRGRVEPYLNGSTNDSKAPILVVGANGRTGRAVVAALARRGARVRGLVRREEHRGTLVTAGAEAILGDLTDRPSLDRACAGLRTVIHIGPPMHSEEVSFTRAMLLAARDAGVRHFIYYSVMHPQLTDLYHHAQKLRAEEYVLDAGIAAHTILQPARYMQHLDAMWPQVTAGGVHRTPFRTDAAFSVVDVADLAEASAIVATQPGHDNATYQLAGPEALTQDAMAAILGEELGRPVRADAITPEAQSAIYRERGLSAERIERIEVMNRHYDAHGFVGNPNILRWILGREATDFRTYARRLIVERDRAAILPAR